MLAAVPPPNLSAAQSTDNLVALLPELILSGAFILLLLLDLVTPPQRRSWLAALTFLGLAGAFAAVLYGWYDAGDSGRQVYFGSFAYDRFGLFVDGILLGATAVVVLISPGYLNRRGLHYGEYYALILAATTGMMLLAGATNLMVIFVAIELLSIALYILAGFSRTEERSQEAALKYLLLGGFASGFLLYGMALIYGETGHTQLALIKSSVEQSGDSDWLLLIGVALLFVGFAFKISAAPFHMWTPDVYQGSPTSVTTFMSVTTKVAAFAALIRVFSSTLVGQGGAVYSKWTGFVTLVAILSMVVGNVVALRQTSIKRMLAYSGIAQAGYILIGVAAAYNTGASKPGPNQLAMVGALYYLAAYALANIGAFAVVTVMAGRGEDLDSYDGLRGLWYRRPYVAGAMGLFLLSLGGFPPTAGFFGKFFVFTAAIQNGQTQLALWGIATSAVSVFYYLRVASFMFQRPREGEETYAWPRTSLAGGTALAASTAGTLVFGIFVFVLYNAASAAQSGLGGGT